MSCSSEISSRKEGLVSLYCSLTRVSWMEVDGFYSPNDELNAAAPVVVVFDLMI